MQSVGPICQLNNLSWRTPLFQLLLLMMIFSMSFSLIPQQIHCIQVCGDHLQTRDCSLLSHHLTGKQRWQSLSLVYWEIQKRFKSYQHHHHMIKKMIVILYLWLLWWKRKTLGKHLLIKNFSCHQQFWSRWHDRTNHSFFFPHFQIILRL